MATPSIHRIVSAPAIWSYGTGDDASVSSIELSTRFVPVSQHEPTSSSTNTKEESSDEMVQQEEHQASRNRCASLNARPKNRQRSMELEEVFPSLQKDAPQPAGTASSVWFYGTGGDNASVGEGSMDWSALRVQNASKRSMDGDSFIALEQDENEGVFSISSSASRSTNRRRSMEFGPTGNRRKSMDLNQSFPSLRYEEEPQTVAIEEEATDDHDEETEVPIACASTPKQRRRSAYSDSWDNLQLTPNDLLAKLMPERFKEAQAIISAKKQRSQNTTPRATSRSDRRSLLKQSLVSNTNLLELGNADSNHTAKTSVASSWSDTSKRNQPETSSEDKQKWGVNGLLEDLQEGTKKKKKRSSSTKFGPKRRYSCPNTESLQKDETKAKKRSSSTKAKKVPSLKRASTCPSSITKLEKKASSSSSAGIKARKRRSDKSKSKDKNSIILPQRCYSCPKLLPEKVEAKRKKKRSSATKEKKDVPPTILTRSSSCPAIAKIAKEERKKKKKSGSSTVRTKDKKLKSKRKSATSKTCSSPPEDSEVRAARAA